MSIKRKIIKKAKKVTFKTISKSFGLLNKGVKTDTKTILFISYHGKGYLCNPKYIHQELLNDSRFNDYNFVWALKNTNTEIEGAKIIKYRSLEYFYYLAKSKFWIVNCKLPSYCKKKKDQIYIQTWHGTPLKRLAHDIEVEEGTTFYRSGMSKGDMTKSYDIDVAKYNYMLSPNNYSTQKFESSFKIEPSKMKELGYPRNDFLVNLTQTEINNLKDKLGVPKHKKTILYAPTWRDNSFDSKGYKFILQADFEKWKEVLGDDYVIIFKPHYLISNKINDESLKDFVLFFDDKADINELYAISDTMITDYSSVFFDFSILKRPIFFYMYDLEEYRDKLRGFYLDIEKDLPGPIHQNELELLNAIKSNESKSKEDLEMFYSKFNHLDDGNASKRVIEQLIIPNLK